jgi:diguanylate cyclase (GGDEF)-like protein
VQSLSEAVGLAGIQHSNLLYSFFNLQPLDSTLLEKDPVFPNYYQNVFLGTVFGLMMSVALAMLLNYFSGSNEWIEEQSIRDGNLGVYNKRYFRKRFDEETGRAYARNRPLTLAAVVARPLEDFEQFPERVQYGLLRKAAVTIEDGLDRGSILAYLGSNTFGVILPEIAGDAGSKIFDKIYDSIRSHRFEFEQHVVSFQSVIGLVTSSASNVSYQEMLSSLDEALKIADDNPRSIHLVRLTPPPFSEAELDKDYSDGGGDIFSDYSFLDNEQSSNLVGLAAVDGISQAESDVSDDDDPDLGDALDRIGTPSIDQSSADDAESDTGGQTEDDA